jgi:predicted alpha/beta hydrolase
VQFVQFAAADGHILHATLYGEENGDAMVIAPAMSVPRRYYEPFAEFAAAAGFAVLVFDYRGFGRSRPEPLRKSPAKMSDWGALDLPAAIEFMCAPGPRSLVLVGQSAGGQIAGLAYNLSRIERIVFVAAQSGYWRHWPDWRKYGLFALWLAMPVVSSLLGFFPARLVGLGSEDLPRGVARDWARFARNPRYVWGFGDELDLSQTAAYRGPLLAWSFERDHYAPRRTVEKMLEEYAGAKKEHRHVADARVGHFGFFRRGNENLWQATIDWLRH